MNHERIFPTDRHGNPLGPARDEVVRCRDCKHHHEGQCMLTDGMGDFKRWIVDDDDYCSDGERAVGV